MQRNKTTAILLVSVLIAGCKTTPAPPPEQIPSLPDELYFKFSAGPIINTLEFRLTHDGVITSTDGEMGHFGIKEKTTRRRVTAQAWQNFQQQVEPLRITHWKRSYEPREVPYDGYSWEFRWKSDRMHVESGGSCAGPDPKNPAKTIEGLTGPPTADILLGRAMAELWEHSVRMRH